jgi:endonuclease YncB( thermonuclease family)
VRRRPRGLSRLLLTVAVLAAILLALRQFGLVAPETGQFRAVDGDSLRRGDIELRLHGIDAPELHQECQRADGAAYACGREARAQLAKLVAGADLTCIVIESDRYGRQVATCSAGNTDINAEMVQSGWATAYTRHGSDYLAEEQSARSAGRGIWQGRFEQPEAWRNRHRDALVRGSLTDEAVSIHD